MAAHKHAAMIKAKADDMDLVVFAENINTGEWWECSLDFPFNGQQNFFLCLPQHKEACLHWLNGLDIEYQDFPTSEWSIIENRGVCSWGFDIVFMQEEFNIRIKPRKEKRLIVYRNDIVYGPYEDKDEINEDFINTGQVIEIEIEV